MTTFIVNRTEHDKDFNKFIIKEIHQNTSSLISIKNIPFKLNKNSKTNVFYYDKYEICITKIFTKRYSVKISPISEAKIKYFKIGCELEVCLDLYCNETLEYKGIILRNLLVHRNKLKKNTYDEKDLEYVWFMLLSRYINNNIIPNLNEKFKSKFPKAYIALKPKSGYSDYTIDFNKKIIYEDINPILNDCIVFTRDASLVCADTIPLPKNEPDPVFRQTLHCEIVSPILNNTEDFKLLYTTILNPKCIDINNSQAFHVNVSMFDINNEPIYFSPGFVNTFLNYFIPYEDLNYDNYNTEKDSKYAMKLQDYVKDFIFKKYDSIMYYDNDKDNKFTYNTLFHKEHFRSYIDLSEKYLSIHAKSDTLLEFRLFPSHNVHTPLLEYVSDCIELLTLTHNDFRINYKERLQEFQKINLKSNADYSRLLTYTGKLYIEKSNFPSLDEIKPNNFETVKEGVKLLFDARYHKVLDIIDDGVIKTIKTLYDDKTYFYKLKYNTDRTFTITSLELYKETNSRVKTSKLAKAYISQY
jgi:hypothetical protein